MTFRLFPLSTALTAGVLSLTAIAVSPAQAAPPACINGTGIAALTALTEGCVIGDKVYSDFNFGFTSSTATFSFTNIGDTDHTFSGAGLALPSSVTPYTYSYKMTALADQKPFIYRTGVDTSAIDPTTATNTLANSTNADTSVDSVGGGLGNLVNLTPGFPIGASPVTFSGSIKVDSGRVDIFSDSVRQTPGPLPILGAGAAFGFSRKLRRRIKATA